MDSFDSTVGFGSLHSRLHPLLQTLRYSPYIHNLRPSSTTDLLAAVIVLLASLGYLTRGHYWDKPDPNYHIYFQRPQVLEDSSNINACATRDIAQRLEEGDYRCVIFWGSQSGTAERLAEDLGRECSARFGISSLVADLSDYDAESIAKIGKSHFVMFLLSTYGEGDPSDNTAGLWDWIKYVGSGSVSLTDLQYVAFGLGNSNYKYYNRVLDVVADTLDAAGAQALIARQRADDARGGTEEDYQSWKDDIFAMLRGMGYEQKSITYQSSIEVEIADVPRKISDTITSATHQPSSTNSAIAPLVVKSARELFTSGDRNCVHMELDLGDSDFGYKTGDHIGIWPCNPEEEIDRLINVLGLNDSRDETLTITSQQGGTKLKIPSPTTLENAFRHNLEICAPVSRKSVLDIAQFAPTPEVKATLLELGQNRDRYERHVADTHVTLARLLQACSPNEAWSALPLSFVIENLLALQPRYYSISSSSVISPRRIAITALVVNKTLSGQSAGVIHGLTSNYLLSTSKVTSKDTVPPPTYMSVEQSDSLKGTKILAHVRKTKFKLPVTSSTPLVLISAGTGFAPFRAFLQERVKLHALGKPVGRILLFFGCRNHEDFIYREEIEQIQVQLGDKLEIITAFSRDGSSEKIYVQERVGQHAANVLELLEAGANMYICGKASMAREVDATIEDAASKAKQLNAAEVKAWAEALKRRGKWRADVWG